MTSPNYLGGHTGLVCSHVRNGRMHGIMGKIKKQNLGFPNAKVVYLSIVV